ncbi:MULTISPECIES: VanZ family protein [unclassified Actinotalea]|uniref:VanZ family protein n=1 Tax=unclassified Actinotalea TaxID=2638618 RepID=UPI0021054B79|nr:MULTISPECIES: VanZ family protein [unclassified Actinotalea]
MALAVYLLAVLRITQWPDFADPGAFTALERGLAWLHARGLPTGVDVAAVEAAANVVMFVPFGILVPLAGLRRAWLAVPLGCASSVAIETGQALFWPTRAATLQDVVMNTLGAAVGVGLLTLARRYARHVPTTPTDRPATGGGADAGTRGGAGTAPTTVSAGLRSLLAPSTLDPVELDLRRVFVAGIGAWAVALVVVGALAASDRATATDVATCATGMVLGGLALVWEHRRRSR